MVCNSPVGRTSDACLKTYVFTEPDYTVYVYVNSKNVKDRKKQIYKNLKNPEKNHINYNHVILKKVQACGISYKKSYIKIWISSCK